MSATRAIHHRDAEAQRKVQSRTTEDENDRASRCKSNKLDKEGSPVFCPRPSGFSCLSRRLCASVVSSPFFSRVLMDHRPEGGQQQLQRARNVKSERRNEPCWDVICSTKRHGSWQCPFPGARH